MSMSLREFQDVQGSFNIEQLRDLRFNPNTGALQEFGYRGESKIYKEVLVSFPEVPSPDGVSLFDRVMELFNTYAKGDIEKKWPNGVPAGRIPALEGCGNLYVDTISSDGEREFSVGALVLSQIASFKPSMMGVSFSSFLGEEYTIRDSHIKLAIAATSEEEGLMGVCLRAMRIAIAEQRIFQNAIISHTASLERIKFLNDEVSSGKVFDENLHWIHSKVTELKEFKNNLMMLNMPEHTGLAYFKTLVSEDHEVLLGSMELQPSSVTKMLELFPQSAVKIINEKWADSEDQLMKGHLRVTPHSGNVYINKLHNYFSSIWEVMSVLGAKQTEDGYVFEYKHENFRFTAEECELAVQITPLEQGVVGICEKIAQLCYLKNSYSDEYDAYLDKVMQMARSGYVSGLDSFIRNTVQHVKLVSGENANPSKLNGIQSEIHAAYSEFIGIIRRNKTMVQNPECEFLKLYMRLSEKKYGSELDIKIYKLDRTGEEIPIKVIEVKNTLPTLIRKIYDESGPIQFSAYFKECEKNSNDYGESCSFDVYITGSEFDLMNHRILPRSFFENLIKENNVHSTVLEEFLQAKRPDGSTYDSYSVKNVLYLALNELLSLKASYTDKKFQIRLWLWDGSNKRFIRFNGDLSRNLQTNALGDSTNR